MAFLLIHIDGKPISLKGQSVVTGIAVTNTEQPLLKVKYTGAKSKINITVLNSGGIVTATPEARLAFSLSKPTPVAVDTNINLV